MHAFEVAGLHKRYGRVQALRGVSFALDPGEVFGFLGPNGAGKTTTLRIALGLVRADAGTARLVGHAAGDPRGREGVGYLPGDLRLWADLTASALLDTFSRLRRRHPPVLRERLLATLGLAERDLSRRVKHLSHGTRQKLGLVIALQHDPELIVLDEPTNGLDPLVQRELLELLAERARAGRAVLLSSHVLSEVEAVCGRVAILRAGEVMALESVDALRGRRVRRARVRFAAEAPSFAEVPGAEVVAREGRTLELGLRGEIGPFLRWLAAHDVEDLLLPEPRLEDVFLSFYGPDGGAR